MTRSTAGSGSHPLRIQTDWAAVEWRAKAASAVDRRLLAALAEGLRGGSVRIVLWDGTAAGPPCAGATVRLANRRTLLGLLIDPDMVFPDAYSTGAIEVEGDFVGLIEDIYRARPNPALLHGSWRLPWRWANTRNRARRQIHHHYDIGNAFYQLWLDERMQYTCAYFPDQDTSLEQAQLAKMEHVCRKLALQPGEHVVEAGCGWGGLALHMARTRGVRVTAFNISHEQIAWAREAAGAAGLSDRVTFVEDDFRAIHCPADVFVSVGMLEHVGTSQYEAVAEVIDRVLDPQRGRGLLHFIGRNHAMPLHPWIERRIFPGAYVPPLSEVFTRILEPRDLSVLDVENLRLHYARTIEHWHSRFDAAVDRVVQAFDQPFARAWRLYLAGSIAGFRTGAMQLFQVVFARGRNNAIPWTRAGVYESR